jgi:hypothetical protein
MMIARALMEDGRWIDNERWVDGLHFEDFKNQHKSIKCVKFFIFV